MDLEQKYRNLQIIPKIRRIAQDYVSIRKLEVQLHMQNLIDERGMVKKALVDSTKALNKVMNIKKSVKNYYKEFRKDI